MAIQEGDRYYLEHTAAQIDEAIDAVDTKADQNALNDEIDARQKLLLSFKQMLDSGCKNHCVTDVGSGQHYVDVLCAGLQAGDYVVSFAELNSTDTLSETCLVQALNGSTIVSTDAQIARGTNVSTTITLTGKADTLRVYATDSSASTTETVDFEDIMLCTEADWNISTEWVPYCPSLYDLYLMVLGL